MYKKEHVLHLLRKIEQTLKRIIDNSTEIDSYHFYYLTPAGMERLDIIAHHYFDLDAEIVYNVVKSNLPEMLVVVEDMISFVERDDE